jgi:predicted nucleic acid-binding protein
MALAEREGAQLITADAKLFAATRADYPYVAELASFS